MALSKKGVNGRKGTIEKDIWKVKNFRIVSTNELLYLRTPVRMSLERLTKRLFDNFGKIIGSQKLRKIKQNEYPGRRNFGQGTFRKGLRNFRILRKKRKTIIDCLDRRRKKEHSERMRSTGGTKRRKKRESMKSYFHELAKIGESKIKGRNIQADRISRILMRTNQEEEETYPCAEMMESSVKEGAKRQLQVPSCFSTVIL